MFPHVLALLLLLVLVLAIAEEQLLAQQAKISGLVQATDYGVKCDGTTDDRLNIAAAVAALPPTNGILQFPAGTCIADVNRSTTPFRSKKSSAACLLPGVSSHDSTVRWPDNTIANRRGSAGSR